MGPIDVLDPHLQYPSVVPTHTKYSSVRLALAAPWGDAAARVGVAATELAGGRYSSSTSLCISIEQSLSDMQRPAKGTSAAGRI